MGNTANEAFSLDADAYVSQGPQAEGWARDILPFRHASVAHRILASISTLPS